MAYAFSTFGRIEPTEHYYDLSGSATHLLIIGHAVGTSAVARGGVGARVALIGVLSTIWTTRLGLYLFDRVSRVGGDSRFNELKRDPVAWCVPWALQSAWCVALQAPLVIAASAQPKHTPLRRFDIVGAAIFCGGLALEAAADAHKDAAKRKAPTAPVTDGVFAWCAYPQYFGELSLWSGAALIALPAATRPLHVLAAAAAPVIDAVLVLGVSGVPLAERSAWRKYGGDPAWVEYRARTPLLFPWPPGSMASPEDLAAAKARAKAVARE